MTVYQLAGSAVNILGLYHREAITVRSIYAAGATRSTRAWYARERPAKLAGVLRTAIGPASLAGQLAVRSTRTQY